ncbi:MAG: hypothetical protein V1647_03170 [Pseudomonadota bacterium]
MKRLLAVFLAVICFFAVRSYAQNADKNEDCQDLAMNDFVCKVLETKTAEDPQDMEPGKWLKCTLADSNYTLKRVSAKDIVIEDVTFTGSQGLTKYTPEPLLCKRGSKNGSVLCSRRNGELMIVVGGGFGAGLLGETIMDKNKIIDYVPQLTIGARLSLKNVGGLLGAGFCSNVMTVNSAGGKNSSVGMYFEAGGMYMNVMLDPKNRLKFKSVELAVKMDLAAGPVYISPKVFANFFKSYCVTPETTDKDAIVIGFGVNLHGVVAGDYKRANNMQKRRRCGQF